MSERSNSLARLSAMDDMRALYALVAIFAVLAFDVAFNNSAILDWIGTRLGLN